MNYIVFDLELTCFMDRTNKTQEIIEIAAIKFNSSLNEIDRFHKYVKPIIDPKLSEFCKKFTGITQDRIESADTFDIVINEFKTWIGEDYFLIAWGTDNKMLSKECIRNKIDNEWLKYFVDIQKVFSHLKNEKGKQFSLRNAIEILNFKWEGMAHSGIDDAINTSKIFISIFDSIHFEQVDPNSKTKKYSKRRKAAKRRWDRKKRFLQAQKMIAEGLISSIDEIIES